MPALAVAAAPCRGRTVAGARCGNVTRNTNRLCGQCLGTGGGAVASDQAQSLLSLADSLAESPPAAEDLLDGLNLEQREAVTHEDGPLVVVAGAGSGKTGVLTRRAAWLVEAQGVDPGEIMAVTFTNKAAEEMRGRVAALVGEDAAGRMTIGTFHATCADLLRNEHEALGLPQDFSIYDTEDTDALLTGVLASLGVDRQVLTVNQARSFISDAKANLRAPGVGRDPHNPASVAAHAVFAEYERRLRLSRALDFDDLVGRTVKLLREEPEVRSRCRQRSRHLLLDEYQDTNPAQTALVGLLAGDDQQVFAVGDPDQSIYGFRSASSANLTGFSDRFPAARTITLNRNYRSTQTILDAANAVIAPNSDRPPRALVSDLGTGEPITFYEATDEAEEAGWVAHRIAVLRSEGVEGHEIAVLTRTNHGTRSLAAQLADAGIPYVVKDGSSVADSKDTRAVLANLRILVNPHDDVAFQRALLSAKGVGDTSHLKLKAWAEMHETSLAEAARHGEEAGLSGAARNAVARFLATHDERARQAKEGGAAASPGALMDSLDLMSGLSDQVGGDRAVALRNLRNAADGHAEVGSFLERVALGDASEAEAPRGFVTLSTVHAAKGLEWDNVFMVGMEEGVMPLGGDEDQEEERRLAYVGMTRAGRRLHLSAAMSRSSFGVPAFNPTSRYVGDVPDHLVVRASDRLPVEPYSLPERPGAVGRVSGRRADGRLVITMPPADPEVIEGLALSPTALDGHSRCPSAFYYKHVARLPVESSPQARVGTHFHAIVERLHGLPAAQRTPERAQAIADEVEAEWRANDHYAGFTDEHYAEARGLLDGYFAIEDPRAVNTVATEHKMRAHLADGTAVTGVIDRLERDADGLLVVTDYKTGRQGRGETPWAVHQGRLYASIVRTVTGETPRKLRIVYPRAGEAAQPKVAEVAITDAHIAHVEHLASRAGQSVRESLASGQFLACPGGQCKRCDFRSSCPASSAEATS